MDKQSHVCNKKLDRVPDGQVFGYRDVVRDDFPVENHTEDGRTFKDEVLDGIYDGITVFEETDDRVLYIKDSKD